MVNLTQVRARSLKMAAPTTRAQAGEAAAADKPTCSCFGKTISQGISKIKIKTKAGIKDLRVCFETLFFIKKRDIRYAGKSK